MSFRCMPKETTCLRVLIESAVILANKLAEVSQKALLTLPTGGCDAAEGFTCSLYRLSERSVA